MTLMRGRVRLALKIAVILAGRFGWIRSLRKLAAASGSGP